MADLLNSSKDDQEGVSKPFYLSPAIVISTPGVAGPNSWR